MADINSSQPKKRKGSFSKVFSRPSTRVDLTPMVDLGFLLITFFVLTTSMTEPMAMNLLEPKEDTPQPVRQSGAMTIILGANQQLFYYDGIFDKMQPANFKKTDFKTIRSLILNKKRQTKPGDLMYIIKADKNSSFGDNINLLDEMAICMVPSGHYAEVDLTEEETELMSSKSDVQ